MIEKLREAGVIIEELNQSTLHVKVGPNGLRACDVTTEPHPLFPTDMQAQYMALMTQAEGTSTITETIFENRFMHASELIRMGADIHIAGNTAVVRGKTSLMGHRSSPGSAGVCIAGPRRTLRRRRDHHRPRVSYRPRLRDDRPQTAEPRRRYRADHQVPPHMHSPGHNVGINNFDGL